MRIETLRAGRIFYRGADAPYAAGTQDEEFADDQGDMRPGDDPIGFIFEDVARRPMTAIQSFAEATGADGTEIFERWLKTGNIPDGVLQTLVGQQRYMVDFHKERLVMVEAFKPWWDAVFLDEEDPEIEKLVSLGWYVWTLSDWPFSHLGDVKKLYGKRDDSERIEYHGTLSHVVRLAFPGLVPLKPPFPVEYPL